MSRRTKTPRKATAHQTNTTPTPNERLETSGTLTWLRADRLTVDPAYQRPVNDVKVRQIAREFDPDAFGVLYVSKRADGVQVIIDGQQRHAAVILMGWGDQRIPAIVYVNLSQAHEAALFQRYNQVRTKPRPLDLHRAAVVAQEKRALSIERILKARDLRFGTSNTPGVINAVGSIRKIHDGAGPEVLGRTLDLSLKAWGVSVEGLQGEILTAIALVLSRYGKTVEDGRMVRALQKIDPLALVRRARTIKCEFGSGTHITTLASILGGMIAKEYNHRLHAEDRIAWDHDDTSSGAAFWKTRV